MYDSYTKNERKFRRQHQTVKTNTRAKSVLDVSKLTAQHFINEMEEEMYSPHFISAAEESEVTDVDKKYEKKKNLRRTERLVLDFQKQLKDKFSVYLKECEKSGIFPADCGLTHRRNLSSKRYDIRNYEIGDDYACALSKVIAKLTQLEVLNLSRNRLTEKGCLAVLKSLNPLSLLELDLSENKLRPASCRLLASNFINPETVRGAVLQRLSLETNPIGNIGSTYISEAVLLNTRLKVLNLSRCNISDLGASNIAEMLSYNSTLVSLLLHWNDIRAKGGTEIFHALTENDSLQILDLSYNSLREKPSIAKQESNLRTTGFSVQQIVTKTYKLAQKMKKCFVQNRSLLHLDLTFCNLSEEEVKIMNEGLEENHSILGLHLFGNSEYLTDARGFVQKKKESPINSHILSRISDDLDTGSNKKLVASNNCWICEGWTLVKFTFIPQVSSTDYLEEGEPVYLNLEFQEFQPDPLHYDEEEEEYSLTRMVPPGPLHYYFTIRGRRIVAKGQNRDYYKGHHSQAISKRKLFQAIPEISNYTSKNTHHRASMFSSLHEPPSPPFLRPDSREGSPAILMNVIPPETQTPKPSQFKAPKTPMLSAPDPGQYASRMSDLKSRKSLVDRYSEFDDMLSGKGGHSSDESVQSQRLEGVSISRAHRSAHKSENVVDIASTVLKVPLTNCIENVIQCRKPIISYFDAVQEAKVYPRTLNKIEWKKKVKKVDPEWEFGKSIFKNLKYDGPERMGSYYDKDLSMARIGKLVGKIMPKDTKKKDLDKEIGEVYDYLRENYGLIVETFKHFGCLQPAGQVVSIGLNALTEMVFQMNVLDGKHLRFADIDLDFYAANFLDPQLRLGKVPEKQLVRFQFTEMLVRLAVTKHIKSKLNLLLAGSTCTPAETIKNFFDKHVIPAFTHLDSNRFLEQELWNEECDTIFKKYEEVIRDLYNKYSSSVGFSLNAARFLTFQDFINIIVDADLVGQALGARQINIIYGESVPAQNMKPVSNEGLPSVMDFNQFIVAIGRVASRARLTGQHFHEDDKSEDEPITSQPQTPPQRIELDVIEEGPKSSRRPSYSYNSQSTLRKQVQPKSTPLHKKIERVIRIFMIKCLGENYFTYFLRYGFPPSKRAGLMQSPTSAKSGFQMNSPTMSKRKSSPAAQIAGIIAAKKFSLKLKKLIKN